MELYSNLDSHLCQHPEEIAKVMVVLQDNSDHHLQFVGTLLVQRLNRRPIQQQLKADLIPKSVLHLKV